MNIGNATFFSPIWIVLYSEPCWCLPIVLHRNYCIVLSLPTYVQFIFLIVNIFYLSCSYWGYSTLHCFWKAVFHYNWKILVILNLYLLSLGIQEMSLHVILFLFPFFTHYKHVGVQNYYPTAPTKEQVQSLFCVFSSLNEQELKHKRRQILPA